MIKLICLINKKISDYHQDETVSYERKNLYLVMSCAFPILIFIGLVFLLDKSNPAFCMFCFSIATFIVAGTIIASITKEQLRFSYFFCISMNFFFTPIMFFMSEGVYYGMVLFFVIGIILTIVLLGRQSNLVFIVIPEFVFDISLIIYSFFHKEKVYFDKTNLNQERGIALSFLLVSSALIFLFIYQNYIHKLIRDKIEKDNESILKAENTKGRFLANMTHEIRTPMNAIIGMTDLILKENLSKNTREHIDTIKTASGQLLQIINNILEFSKLDSGRAELVNNEYSFRNMIEEVVSDAARKYAYEDVSLHIFLSKNIPDKLFGDEVRIKQVLRYLLFSPLSKNNNGTVNLEIGFDYDSIECIIRPQFRIASTGSGLTEEEIAAIYNAYSNYDSRQKTDYNRTGLEISICQKILNMMGGELRIDSIEGIGNAIEFSFSNYVVDEKPIVRLKNENSISSLIYLGDKGQEYAWQRLADECNISATYVKTPLSFRSAIEKRNFTTVYVPDNVYNDVKEYIEAFEYEDKVYIITSMTHSIGDFGNCKILRHPVYLLNFIESINGKYDAEKYMNSVDTEEIKYPYARVLCVDDSEVNLKVLKNILKEYDITPVTCTSGKEALSILETNEFDLMLIDHKMPEMDGTELIRNIKLMSSPNATVPMICATADFGPTVKENLVKEGFTDYLAKPININYLNEILKDYLPEELEVKRIVKTKKAQPQKANKVPEKEKEVDVDPLEFTPEIGLNNLGGSKEAYLSVLLAYYKEGVQKLSDVPMQFASGDISLYTTNVHALKSSSATVGCMGISPMFKALEFAGKGNDTEFISQNSDKTFELFVKVLDKVRDYLDSEGMLQEESVEAEVESQDIVQLDVDILSELSGCIMSMNLRRCEEIIESISANNYGSDINAKIKKIKECYDNFEYMEIKAIIEEII